MASIHDDVRYLEAEVLRLTNENRDLELENAQYRQRAEDAEGERNKAQAEAKQYLRDATEASTMLEGLVQSFGTAMKRYRQNVADRGNPEMHTRPRFTSRIEDDVARRGALPPDVPVSTAVDRVREDESEASRALRSSHNELDRVREPPREAASVTRDLNRLADSLVPRTPPAQHPDTYGQRGTGLYKDDGRM